ncbi:hypothetical protein FRC03_004020, partial [Tulasnella sp. 419]
AYVSETVTNSSGDTTVMERVGDEVDEFAKAVPDSWESEFWKLTRASASLRLRRVRVGAYQTESSGASVIYTPTGQPKRTDSTCNANEREE